MKNNKKMILKSRQIGISKSVQAFHEHDIKKEDRKQKILRREKVSKIKKDFLYKQALKKAKDNKKPITKSTLKRAKVIQKKREKIKFKNDLVDNKKLIENAIKECDYQLNNGLQMPNDQGCYMKRLRAEKRKKRLSNAIDSVFRFIIVGLLITILSSVYISLMF